MAAQNFLIMNLLRIMTPEEIGEIATKHNGGKFLSLTELVEERNEYNIHRDFSNPDALDDIHEEFQKRKEAGAKILPFRKNDSGHDSNISMSAELSGQHDSLENISAEIKEHVEEEAEHKVEHKEDENMSSFILIEKERLKRSQKTLKQKEIVDLYQKNIRVDVEQIKAENDASKVGTSNSGVLVNKRHY